MHFHQAGVPGLGLQSSSTKDGDPPIAYTGGRRSRVEGWASGLDNIVRLRPERALQADAEHRRAQRAVIPPPSRCGGSTPPVRTSRGIRRGPARLGYQWAKRSFGPCGSIPLSDRISRPRRLLLLRAGTVPVIDRYIDRSRVRAPPRSACSGNSIGRPFSGLCHHDRSRLRRHGGPERTGYLSPSEHREARDLRPAMPGLRFRSSLTRPPVPVNSAAPVKPFTRPQRRIPHGTEGGRRCPT